MLEAILRQLVNGAVKGELRHIDRVLKLIPVWQEARAADVDNADTSGTHHDPQSDIAVLEALAEMFGSDPEQLFASIQGGLGDAQPAA